MPRQAPGADDANDLRGFHFRLLIAQAADPGSCSRPSRSPPASPASSSSAPPSALPALGAALLVGLLVVFAIADSRSEDAFFDSLRRASAA